MGILALCLTFDTWPELVLNSFAEEEETYKQGNVAGPGRTGKDSVSMACRCKKGWRTPSHGCQPKDLDTIGNQA